MPVFVEERKAGNKTCPLSIGTAPIYSPSGDGLREGGPWGCCGSECMAWRFARTHISPPDGGDMVQSDDTHGYCGLAGVPGMVR